MKPSAARVAYAYLHRKIAFHQLPSYLAWVPGTEVVERAHTKGDWEQMVVSYKGHNVMVRLEWNPPRWKTTASTEAEVVGQPQTLAKSSFGSADPRVNRLQAQARESFGKLLDSAVKKAR